MGSEIDALKLVSSMTLFREVQKRSILQNIPAPENLLGGANTARWLPTTRSPPGSDGWFTTPAPRTYMSVEPPPSPTGGLEHIGKTAVMPPFLDDAPDIELQAPKTLFTMFTGDSGPAAASLAPARRKTQPCLDPWPTGLFQVRLASA
jgi:hypothetical protein